MGQSYFTWNGIDCRAMGVWLQDAVAVIRPEERVEHIQVPGRPGDLTAVEGDDIYNSYIQTAALMVKGRQNIKEVYQWLRGSGYVSFSEDPDKKQAARIIGAITLNRYSRNQEWYVGECQFYCQPFKELITEEPVTVSTNAGASLRNNGDVEARSMYKLTPSSSTGATVSITVRRSQNDPVGQKVLTISGLTTYGQPIVIDCDSHEIRNTGRTNWYTPLSSGEFPTLFPGDNYIFGSGWSSVEITKRERYL